MYLQRILSVAHLCRNCVLRRNGSAEYIKPKTICRCTVTCLENTDLHTLVSWWHLYPIRDFNAHAKSHLTLTFINGWSSESKNNLVHLNIPHIVSVWSRIDYCAIVGIRDYPFLYRISNLLSTVSSIFIHLSWISTQYSHFQVLQAASINGYQPNI